MSSRPSNNSHRRLSGYHESTTEHHTQHCCHHPDSQTATQLSSCREKKTDHQESSVDYHLQDSMRSLSVIGTRQKRLRHDLDLQIAQAETRLQQLKDARRQQQSGRRRQDATRADFWKVPNGNLNTVSKTFLQKLLDLGETIALLRDLKDIIRSSVRWKSLELYGTGCYYDPHVGDTINIVYDDDDENSQSTTIFFSRAKRWVKRLDDDAPSYRVFQFDLDAQGGGAVPGMPIGMSGYTGELVLLQLKDRQSKFEKQMAEKAKKEGHCCAYEAHGHEEECSNCGDEDCDCGAYLDRCLDC